MITKEKKIEFRKLKSLEKLPNLRNDDGSSCIQSVYDKESGDRICSRTINDIMYPKFGDGKKYRFTTKVYSNSSIAMYTHYCPEDDYWYHESWFIEEDDFLEDDLFTI
jgi:hypothetical protein